MTVRCGDLSAARGNGTASSAASICRAVAVCCMSDLSVSVCFCRVWLHGSLALGWLPVYSTTRGFPNAAATPGARRTKGVVDEQGNLFLWGGLYNGNNYNDIWSFSPTQLIWTWYVDDTSVPPAVESYSAPRFTRCPTASLCVFRWAGNSATNSFPTYTGKFVPIHGDDNGAGGRGSAVWSEGLREWGR
jgi:hypothetical protein